MLEEIILQQALFGYRDGHNLLVASTSLHPRVRQFLATVTDSSGPENSRNFDGAFTGMPVPETDFYALFCTWLAPEMKRPGCVWSHVILVQLVDLAKIPNLYELAKLCRRPSIPTDLDSYSGPHCLGLSIGGGRKGGDLDSKRLCYLIRFLYGNPQKDIVILDEDGSSWEKPIFDIWTQQWPRLRREFAFSTGSLGDRRLAGVSFDLQVAPPGSERLWRRSNEPTLILNYIDSQSEGASDDISSWAEVAIGDFDVDPEGEFRKFLFDYGSDVERPREAFVKLATVYKLLEMRSLLPELLEALGSAFPNGSEAVLLKKRLIHAPIFLNSSEKVVATWAVVSTLLDSPYSDAFRGVGFDFSEAAVFLWKEKREQTIDLLSRLVQRDERPAALELAEAIAKGVDAASLTWIGESHGGLVPLVIRHNVKLAYEAETWRLGSQIQTQVYDTLKKLSLSQQIWGKVVGAMFIAATYVSVRDAIAMAGEFSMVGALRWLEDPVSEKILPSHGWRDALAGPATELLREDRNLEPAQLALSAWCVPADILRDILHSEREDVRVLGDAATDSIPVPLRLSTSFLLLTLGLRSSSDYGVKLIIKNFFAVHSALSVSAQPPESWWLLSPELPSLGWWKDWDHCKRLRHATRYALAQRKACSLLRSFASTPDEIKIVKKFCEFENNIR